jgi:hypothetical protein
MLGLLLMGARSITAPPCTSISRRESVLRLELHPALEPRPWNTTLAQPRGSLRQWRDWGEVVRGSQEETRTSLPILSLPLAPAGILVGRPASSWTRHYHLNSVDQYTRLQPFCFRMRLRVHRTG